MAEEKAEIVIINRIPTLRKLTVTALVRLGWENILEFSNISEGLEYLQNHPENCILILEVNANKDAGEAKVIKSFVGKIPIVVTLQVPEKKLILTLSEAGAQHIVVKTFDISQFSQNLNTTIQSCLHPKRGTVVS